MTKQDYDDYRSKRNPIETLVDWASVTYKRKRKEYGLSTNDGECWEGEISELEGDCVITDWEYNWSGGGHNEGTCVIPLDAILGDEQSRLNFIQSLVESAVLARDGYEIVRQMKKQKARLETYKELKKEFG